MAGSSDPMPRSPDGGLPAPSFSGVALDRAATARADPEWVAECLRAAGRRAIALSDEGLLVQDGDPATLVRIPSPTLPESDLGSGRVLLLGIEAAGPLFAIDLDDHPGLSAALPEGARVLGLRDAGALLSPADAGLAAYATALANWHRRHRFCANCGAPTVVREGGYVRRCPACGASHFPRTDPVVIMLVESERGLLLGRRRGWPAGRYSLLAGFVAPGETLEDAVRREVFEESGIVADDPRFIASQPWPFPASLMLGFAARSDGGEPAPRDGELEEVGWFSLTSVRAALAGEGDGSLLLPPSISIARFIIERRAAATADGSTHLRHSPCHDD